MAVAVPERRRFGASECGKRPCSTLSFVKVYALLKPKIVAAGQGVATCQHAVELEHLCSEMTLQEAGVLSVGVPGHICVG